MTKNTVISYPIPAYQNLPIHIEFYKPRVFNISAIGLGTTTLVTTSVNHDYVVGQQVRLIIPQYYGSYDLNEKIGYVVAVPAPNQVQIDLFSIGVNPFIPAPVFKPFQCHTLAQILAIGDVNTGAINDDGRRYMKPFIPGSFRDISPR